MELRKTMLMRMTDYMKNEHKSHTLDQMFDQADLMLLQAAVYR
jgi:hypothetical protein